MRAGRVVFAGSLVFIAACEAIAGLDDFELVDCPANCDASRPADADADAAPAPAPPLPDAASTDGAIRTGDAGIPLLSGDASLLVAPQCGIGTCPKIDGGECSAEPCNSAPVWTVGQGGGQFGISLGSCVAQGDPGHQVFVAHTIDGGARYEYDLHFDISEVTPATHATLAVIDFGNQQARLQIDSLTLQICNVTACAGSVTLPSDVAKIEIYGMAGEGVAGGSINVIVGESSGTNLTCITGLNLPLPTPVTAAPTARVGCLGAGATGTTCQHAFDNVTFEVVNL